MKANWRDFAVDLFETQDADPGYYALARADLPESQKLRFVVGWVTYYAPGIAAKASEYTGRKFWRYLFDQYSTAKRASERRHFRGEAGLKAMRAWEQMFSTPEHMVEYMRGRTYFDVRFKAKTVPQIGAYFTWKFSDLQERVFRIPCDFTGAEEYSPKVPQEGAKLIAPRNTVTETYAMIVKHMAQAKLMLAPPWYDRQINIQEAETVCCVYHQYLNDDYWWGSRTAKAVARLAAVPCETSDALIDALNQHWQKKDLRAFAAGILEHA